MQCYKVFILPRSLTLRLGHSMFFDSFWIVSCAFDPRIIISKEQVDQICNLWYLVHIMKITTFWGT